MKTKTTFFLAVLSIITYGCGISNPSNTTNEAFAYRSSQSYNRTNGLYSNMNAQFAPGRTVQVNNARIIQTINPHFGLAMTPTGLIFAVSTSDSFDTLYDDLIIAGAFVMIDTYTYETREDEVGRTKIKTIPLVVPLRDYIENKTSVEL